MLVKAGEITRIVLKQSPERRHPAMITSPRHQARIIGKLLQTTPRARVSDVGTCSLQLSEQFAFTRKFEFCRELR